MILNADQQLQIALAVYDRLPARARSAWAGDKRRTPAPTEHPIDARLDLRPKRGRHGRKKTVRSSRPLGVRLTPEAREQIIAALTKTRMHPLEIALQVGCSDRTVERIRASLTRQSA